MSKGEKKRYRMQYSGGRDDELFEIEDESECQHQLVNVDGSHSIPFGKSSMSRGACVFCSNTYVEETDSQGKHVAFYRKVTEESEKPE